MSILFIQLKHLEESFFEPAIKKLVNRYDKYLNTGGYYVENKVQYDCFTLNIKFT